MKHERSVDDCDENLIIEKERIHKIPILEYYPKGVSKAIMSELLCEIDLLGYDTALENFITRYPNLRSSILDNKKIDWLWHGLGNETHRCLEIGSKLGSISEKLSYIYDYVYSIEISCDFIEFQKRRYRNINKSNILVSKCDLLLLPFKDNSFDLIVGNGILEYIELNYRNQSLKEVYMILKELKRVLKENGCIYFGVKNRIGIQFSLDYMDYNVYPHTTLWNGRTATRFIDKVSYSKKKKRNKICNTSPCTLSGYQSLFGSAGFTIRPFWVFPSYDQPYYTGEIKNKGGIKSLANFIKITYPKFESLNVGYKIIFFLINKLPSSIVGYFMSLFAPYFLFYCYKKENNVSVDRFIKKVTMLENFVTCSDDRTVKYLLCNKDGKALKMAYLRRDLKCIPHNINYHSNTGPGDLPNPNENIWYSDWIDGREVNPSHIDEIKAAINWLVVFQNGSYNLDMDQKFIDQEITNFIEDIKKIKKINIDKCVPIINSYKSYLLSHKLKITPEHGDYWYGNVLINDKEIFPIDWEFSREKGDPLLDFVEFVINIYLYYDVSIIDLLKGDIHFPGLKEIKEIMRNHFDFEPDFKILIPYTILRLSTRKKLKEGIYDKEWIKYSKILDIT